MVDPLINEVSGSRMMYRELLHPKQRVVAFDLDPEGPFLAKKVVGPVPLEPHLHFKRLVLIANFCRDKIRGAGQQDTIVERDLALVGDLLQILVFDVDGNALGLGGEHPLDVFGNDIQLGLNRIFQIYVERVRLL